MNFPNKTLNQKVKNNWQTFDISGDISSLRNTLKAENPIMKEIDS
jgi:hypothetical protein